MATPVSITIDKLFEYIIAAMLRASGYVAGVPIRRIGGRGTTHQIDVIGIEFTHLPFLYDTILLVEAKCYDPNETVGIDVVRQVKSNILDLEQTLPRNLSILPRNLNPLEYFTRELGNEDGEELTVCYRGAIFTTGQYSRFAKQFAYAHGIYLFNFPPTIYGRKVVEWIKILRNVLYDLAGYPEKVLVYLPRIRAKETWVDYYGSILNKLRENYSDLQPEERHYLFTLIRGILRRHEGLEPFWREIRKICLVDLNGYPVVAYLSERRSIYHVRRVLKQYIISAEKWKGQIYGSRAKISDMRLAIKWSEPLGDDLYEVAFLISDEKLKTLIEGRLFVQRFFHELFDKGDMTLTLPIAEGLNLIAKSSGKLKRASG